MNTKHLNNTLEILHDQFNITDKITPKTLIIEDLGADSFDLVELVIAFEELYNIEVPDEEFEKLRRVSDVVDYLERTIPEAVQIGWKGKCPEEQEAIDALNKDLIPGENEIRPAILDPEHYPEDREAEGDCFPAPCSVSWLSMDNAPKERPILAAWGTNASGAMGWDVVKYLYADKWKSECSDDKYPADGFILMGWQELPSLPKVI